MVVVGDVHVWAHDASKRSLVAPRLGKLAGSYKRGHATGVSVRLYVSVVVDKAVCGRVHDAT